jgi:hypothetical protein
MTVAALFASPAEVEANTPVTRDRTIDVIRIVSLVAVVVGHTIMATSTLRDDVFIWSNLLTASVVLLRTQPGRPRDPTSEEHDAAIAAVGRARNNDVRVRDCRRAVDRTVGAAPARVVADGDRKLRGR